MGDNIVNDNECKIIKKKKKTSKNIINPIEQKTSINISEHVINDKIWDFKDTTGNTVDDEELLENTKNKSPLFLIDSESSRTSPISNFLPKVNEKDRKPNKAKRKSRRNRSANTLKTRLQSEDKDTDDPSEVTIKSASLFNIDKINTKNIEPNSLSNLLPNSHSLRHCNQRAHHGSTLNLADGKCSSQDESTNELLSFFSDKRARIMIITWNMAGISDYPEDFSELIRNNEVNEWCDMYLFCFQEAKNNKSELLYRIQMTFGVHYVIYDQIENKKLLAVLVGHKKFIWNIGIIGMDVLSTRVTTVTKGVAAFSFYFFGSSFLFLGSHLSSDVGKNTLRFEDYQSILYSNSLIKTLAPSHLTLAFDENDLSRYFDYTLWAGDLNFRLTLEDMKVRNLIYQEQQNKDGLAIEKLLEHDELMNGQIDGTIFQEFEEGRITFLPTYKFLINTNEYNETRTPAYTDRILFKSEKSQRIDYLYYSSVESYVCSDHKPVLAIIEVSIKPQLNEYFRSSGKFNKEIYDKCFKSFENKSNQQSSPQISPKNSAITSKACSIQ